MIRARVLSLAALLAAAACARAAAPPPAAPPPAGESAGGKTFAEAIVDAAIAEPSEVSTRLTPIVPSNARLVWKGDGAARRVLLVTWTSWAGYDARVGQEMALEQEVWVTAVPELKDFCRALPPGDAERQLRLVKLLGLRPDKPKDRFVEVWASPDDLFRPCPDPEITDRECSLDFPRSPRFVTVSEEHQRWFEELRKKSYGPDGYPWTRLGYTYDYGAPWGSEGLSEFVIRKGATIAVHAVTKTPDYCR